MLNIRTQMKSELIAYREKHEADGLKTPSGCFYLTLNAIYGIFKPFKRSFPPKPYYAAGMFLDDLMQIAGGLKALYDAIIFLGMALFSPFYYLAKNIYAKMTGDKNGHTTVKDICKNSCRLLFQSCISAIASIIQIVTYPIVLAIKIPLRGLATLFAKQRVIEDKPSIIRTFNEANKALKSCDEAIKSGDNIWGNIKDERFNNLVKSTHVLYYKFLTANDKGMKSDISRSAVITRYQGVFHREKNIGDIEKARQYLHLFRACISNQDDSNAHHGNVNTNKPQ
jgi:hypothetical protein